MKFSVSVLLINPSGQVLSVSRKYDTTDMNLPGGKVEPGETFEQAVIRETLEETGLTLFNVEPLYVALARPGSEYQNITFTGEYTGEIRDEEPAITRWIPLEDLIDGTFGQYNFHLLQHLHLITETKD